MATTNSIETAEQFARFVENLDVPELDVKDREGRTNYIDFIQKDEITSPVMKGKDKYSRPFVIIKAIGKLGSGKETPLSQTFFERYPRDKSIKIGEPGHPFSGMEWLVPERQGDEIIWMGCGRHGDHIFSTYGGMKANHFNLLKDLIEGKTISLLEFCSDHGYKLVEARLSSE